jgi:hypothetical protein
MPAAESSVHLLCPTRGDRYDAGYRFGGPTISRSPREQARLLLLRTDYRNGRRCAADGQVQLGSPAAPPAGWEA